VSINILRGNAVGCLKFVVARWLEKERPDSVAYVVTKRTVLLQRLAQLPSGWVKTRRTSRGSYAGVSCCQPAWWTKGQRLDYAGTTKLFVIFRGSFKGYSVGDYFLRVLETTGCPNRNHPSVGTTRVKRKCSRRDVNMRLSAMIESARGEHQAERDN
jgi:hypothetical protein